MSREKDSYAVEVKTEISLSRSQVLGLYTMLMTAAAIIKKVDPDLSEEIMTSHSFELFEDFLSSPTASLDPVVKNIDRAIKRAAGLAFQQPKKKKSAGPIVDAGTFEHAETAASIDALRTITGAGEATK